MECVAVQVTAELAGRSHPALSVGRCVPERVSTADFVRRMSKFLCFN